MLDNLKAARRARPTGSIPSSTPRCARFARALWHGHPADQARTRRGTRARSRRGVDYVKEQRPQGPHVRQPGGAEPLPARLGDDRGRHAHLTAPPASRSASVLREVEKAGVAAVAARSGSRASRKRQRPSIATATSRSTQAYYSVPPEYLGRRVWVRWDGRWCASSTSSWSRSPCMSQHEPGRFSTQSRSHLPAEKISGVERGAAWLLGQARRHRPASRRAGPRRCCKTRGVEGVRVLHGPAEPGPPASAATPSIGPAASPCPTAPTACGRVRSCIERARTRGRSRSRLLDRASHHPAVVGLWPDSSGDLEQTV